VGRDRALLLVREYAKDSDSDLPQELYSLELPSGSGAAIYRAPRDVFLSELDWVADR
jgi:hypothetical protein